MLMIGCANAAIPSSCAAVEADGTRFASSDEPLIVAFVLGVRGLSNSQLAVDRGHPCRLPTGYSIALVHQLIRTRNSAPSAPTAAQLPGMRNSLTLKYGFMASWI
ncbi:hypothetical protein PGTUg99_034958 [Puccinia graminis f. sp. tritici]|uniref:Uncharacterized protein n=1 Tax=Puccinia graminis f. sp. tritici TaxID=56615 RepID=A0A5B0NL63_PUCGR|nr:hypothetical protein PGTUg99_034958 [Puccinia graminis f. sp. tritici]